MEDRRVSNNTVHGHHFSYPVAFLIRGARIDIHLVFDRSQPDFPLPLYLQRRHKSADQDSRRCPYRASSISASSWKRHFTTAGPICFPPIRVATKKRLGTIFINVVERLPFKHGRLY